MKKPIVKIAIIAVVCLVVLFVVLAMSLGSIVKKGVERVGPQITKTEMKLDGAILSILSGSGTLKGFFLGNPEGYSTPSAIKVGEISVGVKPRSVIADKIHVTHVKMKAPEITFEGTLGGKNNLNQILDNVEASSRDADKTQTEPAGPSKKFQVDDFLISGAIVNVNVSMAMVGGRSISVPLPEIHFTNLGTGPEGVTAAELTKRILNEVTAATLKVVEKVVADAGKGVTDAARQEASKAATNVLDKATKGVGDLFKKK